MPSEPLSPRPIRLSQKLRDLSRLRSKGIEDKGEAEQFRMVHTPDRPHRIITPVEAPSEEECGDTISSWHKAVKDDSDSEGEEEKPRPARSYWKTPDYTGGHPGQFQSQHHEAHARGHSHIYTPSGLSQEVHVDSFQDRSRGARRSVSEHVGRTYSESPVPRPLVTEKSRQRQAQLQPSPPPVRQNMERDISRGRGREKVEPLRPSGAVIHSLPREYKAKTMEAVRRGQCPYCRCQLGNRTYLTCPNPPCGKGLTTFEGSWIAPPQLKDRRPASPSIFGVIGRQLLGRPLKSSPDTLATLPESIASIGTQRYRTPPPPPTSTSRRARTSSPADTPWSQSAQGQGQQAPAGSGRDRKRVPPPVHIQQHPRFDHRNTSHLNTSHLRDYSSDSSGASTPTPSRHRSPAPPLRSAPPQITLPLRPAPPTQPPRSAPLRAPASLNNLQPTPTKQPLVSKFSTAHLAPQQQQQQQYPPTHIASALSSSLPPQSSTAVPPSLDWIPPSERSLFFPHSYSKPPTPPKKSSRRRSQSQHTYPHPQPQQPKSRFNHLSQDTTTQSDVQSDYLDDIYSHYNDPSSRQDETDVTTTTTTTTTKPAGLTVGGGGTGAGAGAGAGANVLQKQKSWSSSKYSTDTTTANPPEKGGDTTTDDDDDDDDDNEDRWNQLDDFGEGEREREKDQSHHVETPTQLRPTPPFAGETGMGKGKGRTERGEGKGGYKPQAETRGLRVATGKEATGREGSKDRLAMELEMRRMKWL
ncbi:hypothetical protein QBC41DRAFT_12105 [Cercophora samala]|uniref:Uncharacterized protein n=1 Tax=Cercophora samala TaxID=330535 RepID=A0AA39Z7C9_9PEZI|nr:hypothetical protein QBC41DRAFT_12105 [Cercophora samala]